MAVIMTEIDKIRKYESLMLAEEVIESALAKSMIEHINAEVALGSITSEEEAITWLKSTFFYTRARLNPVYYKLSKDVEGELGSISKEHLQRLEHFHLIQRQGEKFASTTLGRACSSNCVQVNTIIGFTESIHMDMSAEDVLKAIAAAQEFVGYPSKLDQRKYLNLLNTQSSLRYRIKGAVNSYEKKVFLLLQAALSGCVIDSWELRQQLNSVLQVSRRVVNVLREYCLFHDLGFPLSKILLWGRQFAAKMWNEDPLVCKQIAGIGEKLATALAQGGIKTLSDLTSSDPRKVEYLCGKNPPFGTNVKSFANGIPRFQMTVELVANTVNIALMTVCTYHPDVRNTAALLLSSVSGSIIAYRRLDAAQTNQGFSFCVKQESLPIRVTVILDNFSKELCSQYGCGHVCRDGRELEAGKQA
jgi:ATP-dependent DNA helicase HFM1/MER3